LRLPWWCGFVWAFVFGSATSVSEGASVNYLLDANWTGAVLVGVAVARVEAQVPALPAIAAATAIVLWLPTVGLRHYPTGRLHPPANRRVARVAALTAHHATVLTDGDLVGYVPPGVAPLVNDPFLFRLFDDRGRAPTAALLRQLAAPGSLVLLSQPLVTHVRSLHHWPRPVLDTLRRDFCMDSWQDGVVAYRRRDAAAGCLPEPGFDEAIVASP